MKYISTWGNAPELNFEDVIITGLATDGGLYVPETWPQLSPGQIRSVASMPYCDVAYEVMVPFVDGTIEDNVHNIALEGTFDDCQGLVKAMFNHSAFRDNLKLSGLNSINWARIMAQIVYYFTSASSLGAPDRLLRFCVPTGNFGDIYAGFVANKMGLPIDKLTISTNMNDILERVVRTGRYEVRGVTPTASPSMDIQVSSNFERLLFDAHGRNSEIIVRLMSSLSHSGAFCHWQLPSYLHMTALSRENRLDQNCATNGSNCKFG